MRFVENLLNANSLFLEKIEEPSDNQLLLTVAEGVVSPGEEYILIGEKEIGPFSTVNPEGPVHQFFFDNYAAYSVFNESFLIPNEDDVREGRLLVEFQNSSYLEYIRSTSTIEYITEAKLRHFAIYCQNHIVYVATISEPLLTLNI